MHTSSLVYPLSVSEVAIAVVNSRSASPVSTVEARILLMLPRLPGIGASEGDSYSSKRLVWLVTTN